MREGGLPRYFLSMYEGVLTILTVRLARASKGIAEDKACLHLTHQMARTFFCASRLAFPPPFPSLGFEWDA